MTSDKDVYKISNIQPERSDRKKMAEADIVITACLDSRPPAYRRFNLHADGRIDSSVHWVESLPQLKSAAAL